MSVKSEFNGIVSFDNLFKIYNEKVRFSFATGIDNISQRKFSDDTNTILTSASQKTVCGTFQFTKYKLKLVSKGRGKAPREISIPTIRDRVILRALYDFLAIRFPECVQTKMPHNIVRHIKDDITSGSYQFFLKVDIVNFYPTINHNILRARLWKNIQQKPIINLIIDAIKNPTVSISKKNDTLCEIGVPQGLAISNILASIYLSKIDHAYTNNSSIKYYRYVDDILIFCTSADVESIKTQINKDFHNLKLKIHPFGTETHAKSKIGFINDSDVQYLGYVFNGPKVRVKSGSIEKLLNSLISIFTSYKHATNKDINFLEWRINLRITGCVVENNPRGWLFFFSEITEEDILTNLDRQLEKLKLRFSVSIQFKKFVRTFYEIKYNRHTTNYIPNFDKFTIDQKKYALSSYFNINTDDLSDKKIEHLFMSKIKKQVRDMEVDVGDFS